MKDITHLLRLFRCSFEPVRLISFETYINRCETQHQSITRVETIEAEVRTPLQWSRLIKTIFNSVGSKYKHFEFKENCIRIIEF